MARPLPRSALNTRRSVVLDADLAAATKTGIFKKSIPGHASLTAVSPSANMMGVAAGLAATGKIPFASYLCHVRRRQSI